MDDARTLTAAIVAGDGAAFARLYEARFEMMYSVARRSAGMDEHACLDIVQDAMLRAVRSMRVIEDWDALDAWLACVARSAALDRLRRERRLKARERRAAADRASSHGETGDDDDLARRIAWLREELAALDPDAARMLELRYRMGMTLERVGRAFGLAPGAADGRIRRTLGALRERAREDDR
ncbi:MAG: sigma-70 family RNA polymerase sigma factor [Phycisphaerales bacterium]|nr:MAG: sigma-70 family RNA polymerase sigma factor [Phycisphaerales bacterium]